MKKFIILLFGFLFFGFSLASNTVSIVNLSSLDGGNIVYTDPTGQYIQFDSLTGSFDFDIKMKDSYSNTYYPNSIKVVGVNTGSNRLYIRWRTNQNPLYSDFLSNGGADVDVQFLINGNVVNTTSYTLFDDHPGLLVFGNGNYDSLPAITHFGVTQSNTGSVSTGSINTGSNLTGSIIGSTNIGGSNLLHTWLFSVFWFYFELFIFFLLIFPTLILFVWIFYVSVFWIYKVTGKKWRD